MPLFLNWHRWKDAWKGGGGKNSLRRYYIVAGTYLVAVVLVFSLLVVRWGPQGPPDFGETPLPSLDPPLEEVKHGGLPDSLNGGPGGASLAGASGGAKGGNAVAAAREAATAADETDKRASASGPAETAETAGAETEAARALISPYGAARPDGTTEKPLPPPARPLPRFELYAPFGQHSAGLLPSGGRLHRLSRGVLLQAEAAAPVSVLWDGRVSRVELKEGLYRCAVLVEHGGGYSTYYGNLREVWVKEGSFVSRGENIGAMPYRDAREEGAAGAFSLPVSGRPPAAGYALKIRTVFSGPWPGPSLPSAPSPPEGEGAAAAPPPPLLYLELRRDGAFLDPLAFIGARH